MGRLEDWRRRIGGYDRVALDTNAVIYFLDSTEPYGPLVKAVFDLCESGSPAIVISALVETELLVGPLRAGDRPAVENIRLLLDYFPGLSVVQIDRAVAQTAARLRAEHGLATPDALIAATALESGCGAIIGNDRRCAARLNTPEYILLADSA